MPCVGCGNPEVMEGCEVAIFQDDKGVKCPLCGECIMEVAKRINACTLVRAGDEPDGSLAPKQHFIFNVEGVHIGLGAHDFDSPEKD